MPAKNRFKKNRFNIPKQINDKLLQQANTEPQTVLANLQSSINGLNEAQHTINQEKYGNNTIGAKKQMSWYRALFDAVINPFSIILIAISVLNVIPLAGPLVNTN
jgi:magnesium-transporting ATPase (P-type)